MNAEEAIPFEATIKLRNDLHELERLSQEFQRLNLGHRIDQKTLFYLNLIGDELITNIISYGYDDELEHCISVHLVVTPTEWTLRIEDDGKPFNPLEHKVKDLFLTVEERSIGGLGIHFVNQIMDEISYERTEQHNVISLKKYHTFGNEE